MEKAYKFRLYPTKEQEILLRKTFGCTRFVYNQILAARKAAYSKDKTSLSKYDCIKMLPAMKDKYPWLKEVDSTALQTAAANVDKAYKNFFRQLTQPKQGKKTGFPRFKSKHWSKNSYTAKMSIAVNESAVKLPKLGWVKARVSTPVKGHILSATVSMSKSGKFFVSICCSKIEIPQLPGTGKTVGLDVGIKDLVITSDGRKIQNPKWLEQSEKKLAKLHRQLSRKPKGSKNREKARIRLARQYKKISNQRLDYLHKITTQLIRDYDIICVESLNVGGMMKNHHLAKAIADCSWSEFAVSSNIRRSGSAKRLSKSGHFSPAANFAVSAATRTRM